MQSSSSGLSGFATSCTKILQDHFPFESLQESTRREIRHKKSELALPNMKYQKRLEISLYICSW